MATFFANRAFDYTTLNISTSLSATDFGLDDNINATFQGRTYQDVAYVEFGLGASFTLYGGTGITLAGNAVTGGTVTGVLEQSKISNGTYTNDWGVQDISISAVQIWNAAQTPSTTDDVALVAGALSGADIFQLSAGADRVRAFGGNDRMFGNGGGDNMSGDSGNDAMSGNAGNDTLIGGTGRDVLNGGQGADRLTGGSDADLFVFNLVGESAPATRDVITDFTRGLDRINLTGIDANAGAVGNQNFSGFIGASAAFTAAGQLKFSGGVLFGNNDADADAEFAITLTGVTALTTADVVL